MFFSLLSPIISSHFVVVTVCFIWLTSTFVFTISRSLSFRIYCDGDACPSSIHHDLVSAAKHIASLLARAENKNVWKFVFDCINVYMNSGQLKYWKKDRIQATEYTIPYYVLLLKIPEWKTHFRIWLMTIKHFGAKLILKTFFFWFSYFA